MNDPCADRLEVLADPTRLGVLYDAQLVGTGREGKAVLYRLAPSVAAGRGKKVLRLGCCSRSRDRICSRSRCFWR